MVVTAQDDAYGLFRRAIVDRDADAWATISARYRPLLIAWVVRCPSFHASSESGEKMADEALARAWRALTPERYRSFPNVSALMAYLRACVTSTVIDTARTRRLYEHASAELADAIAEPAEETVLEGLGRLETWKLV